MNLTSVVTMELYGGLLLLIISGIIIALFINDFIRRRMIQACKRALEDEDVIAEISADSATADYLKRNYNDDLYRIDELISKKGNIIKYKLCLKKRSFDFYLKKQKLLNYKVISIKMY
jgi:hypothetical protein